MSEPGTPERGCTEEDWTKSLPQRRKDAEKPDSRRSERQNAVGGFRRDATADYSDEMMHTALDINIRNYANAIVATSVGEMSASDRCRSIPSNDVS